MRVVAWATMLLALALAAAIASALAVQLRRARSPAPPPRLLSARHPSKPVNARLWNARNSKSVSNRFDIALGKRKSDDARAEGARLIFVKADPKYLEQFLDEVLPKLVEPFVLVTGCADRTIPYQRDVRYPAYTSAFVKRLKGVAAHPLVIQWHAENLDELFAPTVLPYPLGMLNIPDEVLHTARDFRTPSPRAPRVMAACRVRAGRQWDERRKAIQVAKSLGYHTDPVPPDQWLRELGRCSHVLCPNGGGYDLCPRLFEAIWMGCVPIARRGVGVNEATFARFPVRWVDTWEELRDLDLARDDGLQLAVCALDQNIFTEDYWMSEFAR